jgi:integrase
VKEKLKAFQKEVEDGLVTEDITFEQWANMWFEDYKKKLEKSTQDSYRYTLRNLIAYFGQMKLRTIKTMHIEKYLQEMKDEGKSSSYVSKMRGMLYQVLNKAEANDLIRKNPVRFAEKMRKDGPVKPKESFTAEEVQYMMKNLPFNRIGLSIRVMLGTGLRGQELLALEPKHIEPDGSMIHVRQAVKVEKGVPYVGSTKSQNSVRDIPVPVEIRPYLIALRSYGTNIYIWESSRVPGRPVNPSSLRKDFKAALEKIGGVRIFTPHACRHTYVSQLQARGVDMETIQSLVGHADTEMTEKYLHVQKEVKNQAIEKLGSLFQIA